MKKIMTWFNNLYTRKDYFTIMLLIVIYAVGGLVYGFLRMWLIVCIESLLSPLSNYVMYISDKINIIVALIVFNILMALPSLLLINKFWTWLTSLPIQYFLYFIIMFIGLSVFYPFDVPISYCIQVSARLLIHQAIGVAIGIPIRKIRSRKQPALAV